MAMVVSPYDSFASEYYDPRHVTSRNFDDATAPVVRALSADVPDGLVLDLGAGRGRAGEYLGVAPNRVIQFDSSPTMLAVAPRESCLLQVLHDASRGLPFPDAQFGCLVAFLCDAFIGLEALVEARRVLRPDGFLIGTIPSFEWGSRLRERLATEQDTARFKLFDDANRARSGESVEVPSYLFQEDELVEMLSAAGFSNAHTKQCFLADGTEPLSEDIQLVVDDNRPLSSLPIVTLFSGRA